jgi:hypothetical protein
MENVFSIPDEKSTIKMKSVIGKRAVELEGHECCFKVSYVNIIDESVGGLLNVLLTEDSHHYQQTELNIYLEKQS